MQRLFTSAALSAVTYSALGAAATMSQCPIDGVCYQVGVPEVSASSGSGNIYFQLKAPTTYSWVALGTGTMMSGANIFLMYADGAGNVTVSARKGTGHVMPQHQTETQLELLAGSGINGDTMMANVKCANCESWDGGSLDLKSSSASFISAWKAGNPLNSKDPAAIITRHDAHQPLKFDLTQATLTDDTNPFVGTNNGDSTTPPNNGNSGSDADSGSGSTLPSWIREIPTLKSAHGILMSIVMVVLYPIGSILMPLVGSWVLHAVWQMVAFLAMWAAFGIGITLAHRTGINFTEHHTILGTVVVVLFGVQPIGGLIHHRYYLKHQKRGLVSHGHIWYGRILMVLGIINGGLGLKLAGAAQSLVIAYSVIAAVFFSAYIGGAVLGEVKRHRGTGLGDRARKASN